jgi:hypothetical protein
MEKKRRSSTHIDADFFTYHRNSIMEWWLWLIIGIIVLGCVLHQQEKKQRAKQKAQHERLRRRQEAEDYILKSGDEEAIKTLMYARTHPSNYSKIMSGGMNKGNDTLKTALGVMTGMIVGGLIVSALSDAAIQSAVDEMHTDLDSLDDTLAASAESDDSSNDFADNDSFDDGADFDDGSSFDS